MSQSQSLNTFIKIFEKYRNVTLRTEGFKSEHLDAEINIIQPSDVRIMQDGNAKVNKATIILDLAELSGMTLVGVFKLASDVYCVAMEGTTIRGFNVDEFDRIRAELEAKLTSNIVKKLNITNDKVTLVELKPNETLLPELPLSGGKPN